MLIEYVAPNYYHVDLADILAEVGSGPGPHPVIRSFATSEQLIEFVKNDAPARYLAVRRGDPGKKLQTGLSDSNYSMANGDIFMRPDVWFYYDPKTNALVDVKFQGH